MPWTCVPTSPSAYAGEFSVGYLAKSTAKLSLCMSEEWFDESSCFYCWDHSELLQQRAWLFPTLVPNKQKIKHRASRSQYITVMAAGAMLEGKTVESFVGLLRRALVEQSPITDSWELGQSPLTPTLPAIRGLTPEEQQNSWKHSGSSLCPRGSDQSLPGAEESQESISSITEVD